MPLQEKKSNLRDELTTIVQNAQMARAYLNDNAPNDLLNAVDTIKSATARAAKLADAIAREMNGEKTYEAAHIAPLVWYVYTPTGDIAAEFDDRQADKPRTEQTLEQMAEATAETFNRMFLVQA